MHCRRSMLLFPFQAAGDHGSFVAERFQSQAGWRTDGAALAMLVGGAGLFLAWMAADGLFLIFCGGCCSRPFSMPVQGAISRFSSFPRGMNLANAIVAITLAVAGLLVWSGFSVTRQIDTLIETWTPTCDGATMQ